MGIIRDRDDTLFLIAREFPLSIDEVAVSLFSFSTDSTTKLMELREPEIFWIEDDDRIRSEEIHSIFDNRRREENVVFSFLEGVYSILDHVSIHASVGGDDVWCFCILTCGLEDGDNLSFHGFKPTDPIMDDDDLTTALLFVANSMSYRRLIPSTHDCFDRFFLFRWCREE